MTTVDTPTDTSLNTTWKTAPTHTIDVDGVEFAYRQLGPSTGVPVIFLNHLAAELDRWDPRVVDGIASRRRVIAFDNRGVGASEGSTPNSVAAMARDAVDFIRALGLEQVDLLGFSLGGFISQVIAQEEPLLVRKVILAGTGPAGGAGIETALYAAADAGDGWGYQTIRSALRRARLTGQSPPADPAERPPCDALARGV